MGIPQGFNAGFARGLASVLQQKRQTDLDLERETRGRQDRLAELALAAVLPRAERVEDALGMLAQFYPELTKDKAGWEMLTRGMTPLYGQAGNGGRGGAQAGAAAVLGGEGGAAQPPASATPATTQGAPTQIGLPEAVASGASAATPPVPAPAPGPAAVTATAATRRSPFLSLSEIETSRYVAPLVAQASPEVLQARQGVVERLRAAGMPLDEQEVQYYLTNGQLMRPYGSGYGSTGMQSVAGELPDGTPVFGVFDRGSGQYLDPMTQQPIPGFRPRTSTGSRTLGTNIEALAIEMFGKQASRLNAEEMAQVNAALPGYLERLSYARSTGTGTAANETRAAAPLSVDDAAQLQAPIGTSMNDLRGQVPMTPAQQQTRQAITTLSAKLPELESMIGRVMPDYGEGMLARARATGELRYKSASADPELVQLRALAKSMAGEVARVVQGQTGVLSDQDTARAQALLTDTDSWFTDTRASALAKVSALRQLLQTINSAIPAPQATGNAAGQRGTPTAGAPATPRATTPSAPTRTPTTATKPRVSNAAPGARLIDDPTAPNGKRYVLPVIP